MGIVKDVITTFVGDRLINLMKSGTDIIADEICHAANNKILEYLSVEYERNSKTKTILHRSEPVELEKIYQPLYLRKVSERWDRISRSKNAAKKYGTENIKTLFEKSNCITIIGTAGSGKSTLVKYLFVDTITRNYKIPLKVELRYLNNHDGSVLSYIKNEIIKFSEIAESDRIVERLLNSGQFVIFFDGFDEIASNKKEEVTRNISQITKKYTGNKYVLTSRPFVNIEMLENFHNYEVCNLSSDEIPAFVKKQFCDSEQELADKIIETINNENAQICTSFLSNPLLLSMFIITYQADSNIPQKKSDYYNQVFNTLYSVHDTSSKLGFVREKKTGLSKEAFIEILKRFSFKSFFSQNYIFSTEYFETRLQEIKQDLNLSFRNEDLTHDLEVAIGILTQEGLDITYPHRSLQEYFAALFVTTLTHENKMKVYEYLYTLIQRILNDRTVGIDNINFFSLLSEMDKVDFQKKLIIPTLDEIRKSALPMETSDIIDRFISIHSIAFLFDNEMCIDFANEHSKYNVNFEAYLNEERKKEKKKKKEEDHSKVYDNARNRLAQNDILPFLKDYDYNGLICRIEYGIKAAERIDSNFINSLL